MKENSKQDNLEISEELAQQLAENFKRISTNISDCTMKSIELFINFNVVLKENSIKAKDDKEKELKDYDEVLKELTKKLLSSKWYNRWYHTWKYKQGMNNWLKLAGESRILDDTIKSCDEQIKKYEKEKAELLKKS